MRRVLYVAYLAWMLKAKAGQLRERPSSARNTRSLDTLIHYASANYRCEHFDLGNLVNRYVKEIAIKHDKISKLPHLERARLGVLVQLVRGVHGDRPQNLLAGKALVLTEAPAILRPRSGIVGAGDANLEREPFVQF